MFYEEKFVNGILMFRNTPDGYWLPKVTSVAIIANNLFNLSEEERLEVFSYFCKECGTSDLPCYCWRDE